MVCTLLKHPHVDLSQWRIFFKSKNQVSQVSIKVSKNTYSCYCNNFRYPVEILKLFKCKTVGALPHQQWPVTTLLHLGCSGWWEGLKPKLCPHYLLKGSQWRHKYCILYQNRYRDEWSLDDGGSGSFLSLTPSAVQHPCDHLDVVDGQ